MSLITSSSNTTNINEKRKKLREECFKILKKYIGTFKCDANLKKFKSGRIFTMFCKVVFGWVFSCITQYNFFKELS